MARIKEYVSKVLLLFSAMFTALIQRKITDKEGAILLVFTGGLGDIILDMQAIDGIVRQFLAEGKNVTILSTPLNNEALSMNINITLQEVKLISCSFLTSQWSTHQNRKARRETIKKLRQTDWERIIVRFNRMSINGMLLTAPIPAVRKTAVLYSSIPTSKKRKLYYQLFRVYFDQILALPDGLTQMQLSREFAKNMGVKSYPIRITHLPEQSVELGIEYPYVTVTVDSSNRCKRWPYENFIELIQWLLKEYPYDVVLTGVNVPQQEAAAYHKIFGTCSRVKDKIGKTALKEWVELIRRAKFHIGVDSSSIHVAAAVGTQVFCLVGVWDKERFYPYKVEEHEAGTIAPICIYRRDMDINTLFCANCNLRGDFGLGNVDCHTHCSQGKPCLCLGNIRVEDAIEVIKENVTMQ